MFKLSKRNQVIADTLVTLNLMILLANPEFTAYLGIPYMLIAVMAVTVVMIDIVLIIQNAILFRLKRIEKSQKQQEQK